VAFVDTANGQQAVVLDGVRGASFARIRAPWQTLGEAEHGESLPGIFFSPDGEHLAYAVKDGVGWAIVVDGKKGKAYEDIDIPVFSPDSRSMAFVAHQDGGYLAVRDGQEGKAYNFIGTGGGYGFEPSLVRPIFTADSQHLVYQARKKIDQPANSFQYLFVIDDRETLLDGWISGLTFPKQGPGMAYRAAREGGPIAVVDGKADPEFGSVEYLAFSQDGRRLAVVSSTNGKSPYKLFIDGKVQATADKIYNPGFSPDGTRVFYIVQRGKGDTGLMIDDAFHAFGLPPVFSPDSRHYATVQQLWSMEKRTTKNIDWRVCVLRDGQPGPTVERVEDIHFSPDSRHLVYRATVEQKPVLVVDDNIRPIEGRIVGTPRSTDVLSQSIFFDALGRFHYFTVKDGIVQRVEETMAPLPVEPPAQAGVPFRNLLLSVECEDAYAVGTPVTITVHEKNVGKEEIQLGFYRFPTYYKLFIQDGAGKPVPKSEITLKAEDEYDHPVPINRPERLIRLQPGEEFKRSYDLRAYVKALPPGNYSLQIMRRAGFIGNTEGPRGGALSLPCRFTIK